jgi:hypothetical protein
MLGANRFFGIYAEILQELLAFSGRGKPEAFRFRVIVIFAVTGKRKKRE